MIWRKEGERDEQGVQGGEGATDLIRIVREDVLEEVTATTGEKTQAEEGRIWENNQRKDLKAGLCLQQQQGGQGGRGGMNQR